VVKGYAIPLKSDNEDERQERRKGWMKERRKEKKGSEEWK
jgi:hypothetical protein